MWESPNERGHPRVKYKVDFLPEGLELTVSGDSVELTSSEEYLPRNPRNPKSRRLKGRCVQARARDEGGGTHLSWDTWMYALFSEVAPQ